MNSRSDRFDYKCQPQSVGVTSAQIASMHEDRLSARLDTRPQINNGRLIRYLEFDPFSFPASLGGYSLSLIRVNVRAKLGIYAGDHVLW